MRAKVRLDSVTITEYSEILKFHAVCKPSYNEDGKDEDNTYAKFTPTANFELHVANPELMGKFIPGEKYYVDFTKV